MEDGLNVAKASTHAVVVVVALRLSIGISQQYRLLRSSKVSTAPL